MRRLPVRRFFLPGLALLLALPWLFAALPARAQGIDLATLNLRRTDGSLLLEFAVRLTLSRTVEDALQRGVPVYFVAEAALYRSRWYWRDERIARAAHHWRVAYQPLTSTWRVGTGGLNQPYATLPEALVAVSSSSSWKLGELSLIEPDSRHYVDFSYRLDTSQLPSPMQIGLGGQADWTMRVERSVRVE